MVAYRLPPLDALSAVALGVSGATLLLNMAVFGTPKEWAGDEQGLPHVSILVPARNEERKLQACVRSLLTQKYPSFEVLVLDDQSEDRTPLLLQEMRNEHELGDGKAKGSVRFRVLNGTGLPWDWSGKNWACHQLAQAADPGSRYLLFTDADTVHAPDLLRRVVAEAERDNLALFSLMPEQRVTTWGEHLLVTLLPLQILGYLPLLAMERFPLPAFAAANGQYMLFRRDAYSRGGGHAAYPNKLAEDVLLAQTVKAGGGRVRLGSGVGLIRCRMYESSAEAVAGFRRSFGAGFHVAAWLVALIGVWNFLAYALPFLRLPFSRTARILVTVIFALRMVLAWRTATPLRGVLAHPFGICTLLGVQALAVYDAFVGKRSKWKGRCYDFSSTRLRGKPSSFNETG